jgi:hypothetical protein
MPNRGGPDLIPVLALVGAVLLLLAGWRLFPVFQRYMAHEDCVAAGYTNCNGATP